MGRFTTKDWTQLKEQKEAEIAAALEELRRQAAYRQSQADKRKSEAANAIGHGPSDIGSVDLLAGEPEASQPNTLATRREDDWKPLDTRRLPQLVGIDSRTRLETSRNAPGMGKPVPSAIDQVLRVNQVDGRTSSSLQDGRDQTSPPLALADQFMVPDLAERRQTKAVTYARSGDVRKSVLLRANGVCECCGTPGFKTESGALYLETHHVIPLADGGSDKEWNVVAICPNDHRRAHFSEDRKALSEKLIAHLETLYPSAASHLRELFNGYRW